MYALIICRGLNEHEVKSLNQISYIIQKFKPNFLY